MATRALVVRFAIVELPGPKRPLWSGIHRVWYPETLWDYVKLFFKRGVWTRDHRGQTCKVTQFR